MEKGRRLDASGWFPLQATVYLTASLSSHAPLNGHNLLANEVTFEQLLMESVLLRVGCPALLKEDARIS